MEPNTQKLSPQEAMEQWFSRLEQPDHPASGRGVMKLLEPRFVSCDHEKREVCLAFKALEWELNPGGSLHGGIIMTCFDMTFGLTCYYYCDQHMVTTVNMSTTFLKPVLLGDVVNYHVKITSLGRTLISMTAEGWVHRNGKDVLAATATATFMKLDKKLEKDI